MFDDPFLTQNLFAMFKIVSQLLFLLARQGCPCGYPGGVHSSPTSGWITRNQIYTCT